MNKEISKPNDIFVSTLVNGNVGVLDLIGNGITASNTQLLNPETYKESNYVKKAFSDEKGVFHEDKFLQAYEVAAKQYQELVDAKTYENLEKYIEYNQNDIFAPLESKKASVSYEITPELNPTKRSHGVSSLFEYGKASQSMRELAQLSKIWDSENQVWLDKTADDRGILGSLFGQTLVYATWDEDGEHEDLLTGRIIKHKKGDWKLNDKGQYYTETLGNRSSHGKQFVAASDTLTKEGSALNKIDVFDSDDLEKSVVGTTVKAMLKIAPYLFPQSQVIWGGVTAALEMAKVLPKFMKVGEGLIMGGDSNEESAFTRSMNAWENYFSKFEKSHSDRGQQSNWSYESIADIVSDTFAQLYQMQAAASLSKLAVKDPTNQAIKKFQKEVLPKQMAAAVLNGKPLPNFTDKEISELIISAAQKMPEVKKAIEVQSKLSKALSAGYMALSSTADVYSDALAGGYDRRTAALAALTATTGLYLVMTNTSLGEWMLDKNVGYSEHANRATILKALRPYYDDIAKSMEKLGTAGSKQEKASIIQKALGFVNKGINKAWNSIKEDGSIYWRNALTESIEEMSEEAVMDATKGVFDLLSHLGFGKNSNASFGIAQDFTSGSFLERYALSAFGGFLGGALFELQLKKIDPWARKVFLGQTIEEVQPSLIHEIVNGRTADVYRAIDELIELDNESAASATDVNGNSYFASANGGMTRGLAVGSVLKLYVSVLEGALIDENANLTDDQLLQKTIRDFEAVKLIKKGGLDKLLISDFSKLTSELASIKMVIAQKEKELEKKSESKTEDKKGDKETNPTEKELEEALEFDDGKYEDKSLPFLKALLEKKRAQLNDFLSGKKSEEYLYKTLSGATPEIRNAVGAISLYEYTFLKYGKDLKDLPKTGNVTKSSVKKEYEDWQKESDMTRRFLTLGADAYGDFDNRFAKYVVDYVSTNYKDVREITYDKLLSGERLLIGTDYESGNFGVNRLIDDDKSGKKSYIIIRSLANAMKSEATLSDAGTSAESVTLQDIFKQDVLKLKHVVSQVLDLNPQYTKLLLDAGKTKELIIEGLSAQLLNTLENININQLKGLGLGSFLMTHFLTTIDETFDKLLESLQEKNLGSLQQAMLDKGYIDTEFTNQNLESTDVEFLKNRFKENIRIDIEGLDVGLSTSLLEEYLLSQETVDGVIAKRVEEYALESVLKQLITLSRDRKTNTLATYTDVMDEWSPQKVLLLPSHFKPILDAINNDFGTKPLETIIADSIKQIASKLVNSVIGDEGFISASDILSINSQYNLTPADITNPEKLANFLSEWILKGLKENHAYKMYEELSKKKIKQNPIFDSLSKIEMHLSEGGPSKVIEILKNLHFKIRKAERFEDYMPKGEEKILLENAYKSLLLLKALVVGMRKTSLGLGNPFGVNQQMSRFLEKNNIKSTKTYETISDDAADLILSDLNILEQLIKGYLQFGERAYSNKVEEDYRIKKQHATQLKQFIDAKASAFTIDNFSLLPTDEEKAKYKEPEEIIALYAHSVYTKFNEKFKTPEEKAAAIKQLVEKLGLKGVMKRSSRPTNLTKDITVLNEYDQLLWLATALGADLYEFYYRYNQLFVGDEKSKLVPLYSQEMDALQAWSFTRSENNIRSKSGDLISVHEVLQEEVLEVDLGYIEAGNMCFINGITGAGKSSAVSAIVHLLNSDKLTYVTAANLGQLKKYHKQLIKGKTAEDKKLVLTGSIHDLMGRFLTKDGYAALMALVKFTRTARNSQEYASQFADPFFIRRPVRSGGFLLEVNPEKINTILDTKVDTRTIPEVIFIDEATQVDSLTLQVLKYLGRKYGFKILASGDSTQRGLTQFGDPQAFRDLFMWTTAKLNLSVRALNNQKGANNIAFNRQLEVYEDLVAKQYDTGASDSGFRLYLLNTDNHQTISYYQDDHTFNGDKFIESFDDAKEDLKLIASLNAQEKNKAIIITKLDADNKPVNSAFPLILLEAGFALGSYEFYSFEDIHDKAVQGSESPYVIVDGSYLQNGASGSDGELLRAVYTFASRSLKGSLMVLPLAKQKEIGLINRLDRFTQADEIPQLADLAKIKEARKKTIETILGDYTPEQLELPGLKTQEIDGKTVAVRKNAKTSTSQKGKSSPKTVEEVETDELKFDESQQLAIEEALNNLVNLEPVNPASENASDDEKEKLAEEINISARRSRYVSKYDPTRTVRWYSALDHLGLPLRKGQTDIWDNAINTGTCLDMDGLFDPDRDVMSQTKNGFIKFRLAIASASSKEDIVDVISSDQDVAAFLYEAAPQVYLMLHPSHSASANWHDESLLTIYSKWFAENVEIDPNYYIFAKKLDWKRDRPFNIIGASEEESVGEGKPVLYFGVRIKSKDVPPILNQYISLGTVSKETYKDKNGTVVLMDSKELKDLYSRAKADLAAAESRVTSGLAPIAVYQLDAQLYSANLSSTLWVRRVSKPGEEGRFESLGLIKRRGFTIDDKNIYLVDSTKVNIGNGKQEYKALVLLACLGYTAKDINPDVRGEKLTFEQKLQALRDKFVDRETGELLISGSYMTLAQSTLMGLGNTDKLPAYQRVIFLNPKKSNIKDVFKELDYTVSARSWADRLSKCRPSSQTRIITELLDQAGVFFKGDKDPAAHLHKYLIGWRDTLQNMLGDKNYYSRDVETLNLLISWAEGEIKQGHTIDKDQFFKEFSKHKHRILLIPFHKAFIRKGESEAYHLLNLKDVDPLKEENGVLHYKPAGKNIKHINIELSRISDSFACPKFIKGKGGQEGNVLKYLVEEELLLLPDDVPADITSIEDFEMYKVQYTANLDKDLGMYGYELLSPIYSLSNSDLKSAKLVEYPHLETKPNRWPERKKMGRVMTEAPEGFDPSLYRPEILPLTAYDLSDAKEYGKKYVKYAKKELTKDGKPVKRKVEMYYNYKKKKWVPLPYDKKKAAKLKKYLESKGRKIKTEEETVSVDGKFLGYVTTNDKGREFRHTVVNKMGFEVRIGDIVLLWGDETTSVRVVGVNKNDKDEIKLRVDAVLDGNGNIGSINVLDSVVEVPLDGVTKMVSRKVAHKSHITFDYYTKGEWDIDNPLEKGPYAERVKSADHMWDIIEDMSAGGYNKALDFDRYYYYAVPIQNMPSIDDGRDSYLSLPFGIDGHKRKGQRLISDIETLMEFHADMNEQSASEDIATLGYTLFRFKRDVYDGYSDPGKFLTEVIDSIRAKGPKSLYIAHQIFFDPTNVELIQDAIDRADPVTFYNHEKTAARFSKPSDLPIGLGKTLSFRAMLDYRPKAIVLSERDWLNRGGEADFPVSEFIRQRDAAGNYILYPHPDFYFKTKDKSDNKKNPKDAEVESSVSTKYKYNSRVGEAIIHKDWTDYIIAGTSVFYGAEVAALWDKRLKGLMFTDKQFYAYDKNFLGKLQEKERTNYSKGQKDKLKVAQTQQQNVLPETIKYKVALDGSADIYITGVHYDMRNDKYMVTYTQGAPITIGGSISSVEYEIELSRFLIQFNIRFVLLASEENRQRIETGASVVVSPTEPTTEPEPAIPMPVAPVSTSPESTRSIPVTSSTSSTSSLTSSDEDTIITKSIIESQDEAKITDFFGSDNWKNKGSEDNYIYQVLELFAEKQDITKSKFDEFILLVRGILQNNGYEMFDFCEKFKGHKTDSAFETALNTLLDPKSDPEKKSELINQIMTEENQITC